MYAPRRATLFFWGTYPDHEVQIMFHPDSISFHQKQNGESFKFESYPTRINAHTWYDIIIVFENDKVTVFKDGVAKKSFNLIAPKNNTNNLILYTNKEYWIDDLEIHSYRNYQYIEPD